MHCVKSVLYIFRLVLKIIQFNTSFAPGLHEKFIVLIVIFVSKFPSHFCSCSCQSGKKEKKKWQTIKRIRKRLFLWEKGGKKFENELASKLEVETVEMKFRAFVFVCVCVGGYLWSDFFITFLIFWLLFFFIEAY